MHRNGTASNQSGSVLVFVLIFIALTVSVALVVHEKTAETYAAVVGLQHDHQSAIYAATAIEAVKEVIEDDDDIYDGPNDDWALIPMVPVDLGYISIRVTPLNARIPLSKLIDENEDTRQRYRDALEQVFEDLEITDATPAMIIDWMDNDTLSEPGSVEVDNEPVAGTTYTSPNLPLNTLMELNLIPDIREVMPKLKSHVAHDGNGPLNVNFASADDIAALVPEMLPYAEDIVSYRDGNTYEDISHIRDAAAIPDDIYSEAISYLTVKSPLFYLKIEVTLGNQSRYYHALVKRDGNRARLVSYVEGTDAEYF